MVHMRDSRFVAISYFFRKRQMNEARVGFEWRIMTHRMASESVLKWLSMDFVLRQAMPELCLMIYESGALGKGGFISHMPSYL